MSKTQNNLKKLWFENLYEFKNFIYRLRHCSLNFLAKNVNLFEYILVLSFGFTSNSIFTFLPIVAHNHLSIEIQPCSVYHHIMLWQIAKKIHLQAHLDVTLSWTLSLTLICVFFKRFPLSLFPKLKTASFNHFISHLLRCDKKKRSKSSATNIKNTVQWKKKIENHNSNRMWIVFLKLSRL